MARSVRGREERDAAGVRCKVAGFDDENPCWHRSEGPGRGAASECGPNDGVAEACGTR